MHQRAFSDACRLDSGWKTKLFLRQRLISKNKTINKGKTAAV
jgi:hypothetical protein